MSTMNRQIKAGSSFLWKNLDHLSPRGSSRTYIYIYNIYIYIMRVCQNEMGSRIKQLFLLEKTHNRSGNHQVSIFMIQNEGCSVAISSHKFYLCVGTCQHGGNLLHLLTLLETSWRRVLYLQWYLVHQLLLVRWKSHHPKYNACPFCLMVPMSISCIIYYFMVLYIYNKYV